MKRLTYVQLILFIIFVGLMAVSCEEEDTIGMTCLTYTDCLDNQDCIDGFCQDMGGDTGNTGGDTGNTGGDTGNTGGDTGNTGGDTGNTGGDTGNTGGDTGDSGNTGNSVDDSDTANTGDSVDDGDTAEPTCGNGSPDIGEVCEPTDTKECTDFSGAGFESGTATCKSDCTEWIKTSCECAEGYTVDGDGKCVDNDECAVSNGGCDQVCTNNAGGRTCSCNDGYTLNADSVSCDDIDECTVNDNPCNDGDDSAATCTNIDGGYTCTCSDGFKDDGTQCVDINECTEGGHNCDTNAACTNTTGSFTCACKDYYDGIDGTSCTYCNTDGQCKADCTACDGATLKCKDNTGATACVECLTTADCTAPKTCSGANQCVNECQYKIELSTTRNYNIGLATVKKNGTDIGSWDATDHPQSHTMTFQVTHGSAITITFVCDNESSYSYKIKNSSDTVIKSGDDLNDAPYAFTADCN